MILQTHRLTVRKALPQNSDIELFFNLWNDPRIMKNVGFPSGLNLSEQDIDRQIKSQNDTEYDRLLIVELSETKELIGECKLGRPDSDGISHTDIKLLPAFWGCGYGAELKKSLVDYLFSHTDCTMIQSSPNVENTASQKMQESAGLKWVDEGIYRFPEYILQKTCEVHYYLYQITREEWKKMGK